jgi:hypothetical protein
LSPQPIVVALYFHRYFAVFPVISTAAPMNDQKLDTFLHQCSRQLEQRQSYLIREFDLSRYDDYQLNWDSGRIEMFCQGTLGVSAAITPIGFYSLAENTWRWGWAKENIPAPLKVRAAELQTLADVTGLNLFGSETFSADQDLIWELIAMACYHLEAMGCYRANARETFLFLALNEVKIH